MKKILLVILVLLILPLTVVGVMYWKGLQGLKPVLLSPPDDIRKMIESPEDMPLDLEDGFAISIFAEEVPGARVMAFDPLGNLWVSQTSEGTISLLMIENGEVVDQIPMLTDLNNPHGLAFDTVEPYVLYFAEQDKISRVRVYSDDTELTPEVVTELPDTGIHFTRTLEFGSDGRLYVSVGSSCNACEEDDYRRTKIMTVDTDNGELYSYATGLRNTVFFTWSYVDGRMWGSEMGRDFLGDDLPPDEINIIEEGKDYGWPWCYGKNIHDSDFDPTEEESCTEPTHWPSFIDIPAHSAPLGIEFIPEEGWPEEYWYDLLIAYHGSWNSTEPTGYKVVRVKLDAQGNFEGATQEESIVDFISGWLTEDDLALGRPVDLLIKTRDGLYITDDKAGVIYKVEWMGDF